MVFQGSMSRRIHDRGPGVRRWRYIIYWHVTPMCWISRDGMTTATAKWRTCYRLISLMATKSTSFYTGRYVRRRAWPRCARSRVACVADALPEVAGQSQLSRSHATNHQHLIMQYYYLCIQCILRLVDHGDIPISLIRVQCALYIYIYIYFVSLLYQ